MRSLTDGDTASSVLAEFLGLLQRLPFAAKAVYLDREFHDGKCLTLLHVHNFAYVLSVIKWGNAIQAELNQGIETRNNCCRQRTNEAGVSHAEEYEDFD